MASLFSLRRRASRRMIIGDVPRDLEDLLDDPVAMMAGPVREMVDGIARHQRGKSVVDRRPMFGIPASPASVRPTSDGREQSFHLTKNAVTGRTAAEFDSYAARHVEQEATTPSLGSARSAATFDSYVEGHGGESGQRPTFLTTLDPDAEVRTRQWDSIEAYEQAQRTHATGGPPRINLRYEADPALMLAVAERNDCPSSLRDIILAERTRVERGVALSGRKQAVGVPWIDEAAPATMAWIERLQRLRDRESRTEGDGNAAPAFKLSLGRATRTVFAADGEFHRVLDAACRQTILTGLNAFIQGQGRTGLPDDAPGVVPVMLSEHVPDRLNNPNNFHFHQQMGERLVMIGADSELEFAPNKVAALTRRDWPKRLRGEFARLSNIELDRLGADVRLNPDTHEDMGIEGPKQTKLHGSATVLERAGTPTQRGLANDAIGWQRVLAQADQDLALVVEQVAREHRAVAADIARVRDDATRRQLEEEEARALAEAERAAALRREAKEIRILIDMALSRAERTARYAPAYADKARRPDGRDTYDAAGWRRLGEQAEVALAAIDADLAVERAEVAEREREAADLDVAVAERRRAIAAEVTEQPIRAVGDPGAMPAVPSPNVAVRIIAETPLLVSHTDSGLVVDPADDPGGLVAGVDLSGVANRLRGVHRTQQRELDAVAAYLRKHGEAAMAAEALANAPPWVRGSTTRWRDTPAFARLLAERRRERLLVSARITFAALAENDNAPQIDLPDTLAQAPRALADVSASELAARGVVLTDEAVAPPPAPITTPVVAPSQHRPAIPPQTPSPQPSVPAAGPANDDKPRRSPAQAGRSDAPGWSDLERRHRRTIEVEDQQSRESIAAHRARLDLDPDRGPRVSADRRKAVWAAAIRAERVLDALGDKLPPLTRHDDLVGCFDAELLQRMADNHLGLALPEIQQRIEAAWRIQREEELGLRAAIWTGDAKLHASIEHHAFTDHTATMVRVTGAPTLQNNVAKRSTDPHLYFALREAEQHIGEPPDVSRHPDAAVRAWLRAQDEAAMAPVLERLRQAAVKRVGLAEVQALTPKPATVSVVPLVPSRTRRRRGDPRDRLPDRPGRG